MKTQSQKEITSRLVALLNKEEIEFINRLGVDALFSTGQRLTKVDIIAAFVDVMMQLDISSIGAKDKSELVKEIMSAAKEYSEQRKYPRVKRSFQVSFRAIESLDDYSNSTTEDLSLGGLRFEINKLEGLPQINQALEIIIDDGAGGPVKAVGTVAWISKKENGDGAKVGVKLTYVRKEDWERFKSYLEKK